MSGSRERGGKDRSRGPASRGNNANKRTPGARQPTGPPVVGKRPSRPGFLAACAVLWFAAALFALFGLHTGWKLIPVICFAGVGVLYLRGAAGSYLRRPAPPSATKKK